MSSLDLIITDTDCPQCGYPWKLRAWFVPGPYDENGHSDEVELDELKCPKCGYEPPEDEWERVEELIYHTAGEPFTLTEIGKIYQEWRQK